MGVCFLHHLLNVNRLYLITGIYSETGKAGPGGAGLQHILEQHSKEFREYEPRQLVELAEASTSIGLHMGIQVQARTSSTRPIFGLMFHGKPLAVAVQVGSNGFVVSMNKRSLDELVKENPRHGSVDELVKKLQSMHKWPVQ